MAGLAPAVVAVAKVAAASARVEVDVARAVADRAASVAVAAQAGAREVADVAELSHIGKKPNEGATLRITWVKSAIGHNKGQKEAIRALGFTRLNQTVEYPDTAQVRGQIFKVKHLLKVEEI